MTTFHGRMVLFFTILNSKVPLPLTSHAEFQHTYMNVIFATFSNGSLLGFSTYLEFIILKPCSQVMHQVQFETIGAKVSEKHSFSKLFSIVDRQWLLKDIQPTLDALIWQYLIMALWTRLANNNYHTYHPIKALYRSLP